MNEEQLKLADLSNVKVGDNIWTLQEGYVVVVRRSNDSVNTEHHGYTFKGKLYYSDQYPSAFTKNPFENTGFQERWMMVRNEKQEAWKRRKELSTENKPNLRCKLNYSLAEQIRTEYSSGFCPEDLSIKYSVSKSTIHRIISRKIWIKQ
jgi:hypothetical protein